MAKKVIATLKKEGGKKYVKMIKMVKNHKDAYEFKEEIVMVEGTIAEAKK